MGDPKKIRINDFDYPLPANLIAQHPVEHRDGSRLLFYEKGKTTDRMFADLPDCLPGNSLIVFNNTRVIRARFIFEKPSGARIEIFCLEPVYPTPDFQHAFASRNESHWKAYIGNLKKWKEGVLEMSLSISGAALQVCAEKVDAEKDTVHIRFSWTDSRFSFAEIMEAGGHIPLPPYIDRADDKTDANRYQTIFAQENGSVAAPTAGLHFSPQVIDKLTLRGVVQQYITLHVGAGTFKPVSAEVIGLHEMHHEMYTVSRTLIKALIEHRDKPVIPVGTTSMRTLESIYWLGVKLIHHGNQTNLETGQWEPYEWTERQVSTHEALEAVLLYLDKSNRDCLEASTCLLIAPGYKFRICTGLITNFHLPKSTLLLLVAAMVGQDWRKAYQFAIDRGFRFLSYGDACLFLP